MKMTMASKGSMAEHPSFSQSAIRLVLLNKEAVKRSWEPVYYYYHYYCYYCYYDYYFCYFYYYHHYHY